MNIDDWKSQIKRGTLEFGILLMISQEPCYGYEIISRLEKSVYPLLRRLLKEEYLSSSWQETTEGLPPRKYYSLTEKGREYLQCMKTEWKNLLSAISDLEGKENG